MLGGCELGVENQQLLLLCLKDICKDLFGNDV